MWKRVWIYVAILSLCGGCASTDYHPARLLQEPVPFTLGKDGKTKPSSYTRVTSESWHTEKLQVAVRRFVPRSTHQPEIWLVGAMHIGEPAFYKSLQEILDARTVVLFEGVNTDHHVRQADDSHPATPPPPFKPKAPAASAGGYSMQGQLATSLGLVFQLEAINYDRAHFLNSDLSIQKLQEIMMQTGGGGPAGQKGKESLDAVIHIMDGNSLMGYLVKSGMEFIASNPKLQAMAKLSLVETIGGTKGDLSDMQSVPSDMRELMKVLIVNRNQKVISDLKLQILKHHDCHQSIAVFYGAGHMEDMENRLSSELHYAPFDQVWLDAIAIDMRKSGISESEAKVTRGMVLWQLKQLRGSGK